MGQIRDLMTVLPRTVKLGDSIVDAAKVMRGEDAGIAPIVEGDRLVGVITDRDIAIRVVAAEGDPRSQTKVEEIASTTLVTIDPEQGLDEALRLMAEHEVPATRRRRRRPARRHRRPSRGGEARAVTRPSSPSASFRTKERSFRVRTLAPGAHTSPLRLPAGCGAW